MAIAAYLQSSMMLVSFRMKLHMIWKPIAKAEPAMQYTKTLASLRSNEQNNLSSILSMSSLWFAATHYVSIKLNPSTPVMTYKEGKTWR